MRDVEVQLFVLQCAVIAKERAKVEASLGLTQNESDVEQAADALIRPYVDQVDFGIRSASTRMSEYYALFYQLENTIRNFIVETLEAEKGPEWWDDCVRDPVASNAASNQRKEMREGVAFRSQRLIDYTNFGELGEIIKTNWDTFGGIMSNVDVVAVEKVVKRLNGLRAPIAHCAGLEESEVVRLKLAIRDWFRLLE